jgi:exosortase
LTDFSNPTTIRQTFWNGIVPMPQSAAEFNPSFTRQAVAAWGLVGIVLAWTFWPTLQALAEKWFHDAGYSHGVLVPLFSGYLLWVRRGQFRVEAPALLPALGLLLSAALLHIVGGLFCLDWFDAVALLPCLAGITLLVGGRACLRTAWPAIAFLFFMIPLPYKLETMLGAPLQTLASRGSAFLLQVLGQPAVREGNTIMLNDVKLGIVEACSGLRMLLTFFAFSTGVAILIRKPALDKLCIILSAVPIALVTNILRITATGVMYQVNPRFAQAFFHDLAGWFMMPVCLALLGLELWILNRLIIESARPRPVVFSLR